MILNTSQLLKTVIRENLFNMNIRAKTTAILLGSIFITLGCQRKQKIQPDLEVSQVKEKSDWKTDLEGRIKEFGHRNWIVVADAAYPKQSNPAIETITIGASQLDVIAHVNQSIEKAAHVDAHVFVDKEMGYITEENAKGITAYRKDLQVLLNGKQVKEMLHEDIIRELDASAELFDILIIKTDLTLPYTSAFFRLECGYWNEKAEKTLRANIKS
jgi:L-fucose mutarotase/ribose pyranase (RbsD/FucU family)